MGPCFGSINSLFRASVTVTVNGRRSGHRQARQSHSQPGAGRPPGRVTATYCDTGTPCAGGIQVWSLGTGIALAPGETLVLTLPIRTTLLRKGDPLLDRNAKNPQTLEVKLLG